MKEEGREKAWGKFRTYGSLVKAQGWAHQPAEATITTKMLILKGKVSKGLKEGKKDQVIDQKVSSANDNLSPSQKKKPKRA